MCKSIFFVMTIIVFSSCSLFRKETSKYVKPPIPGLDPAYTNFHLDAGAGGDIKLESGTILSIPADAFVDKDNKAITGLVDIKYREFHNAGDVYLSGITMNFNDKGRNWNFQTAGMFDIRASQNNQEIFIRSDKNITVKMASFDKGGDYQFYRLDEKDKGWTYVDTRQPEINSQKDSLMLALDKKKPRMAFPLGKEYFVFDYYSILDAYYNDDYYKVIDNEKNPVVKKKALDYGLTWSGIRSGYDVKFMGNYEPITMLLWKKTNDIKLPKWAKSAYVHSFNKINGNTYTIEIRPAEGNNNKKFTFNIEAVMTLRSLFAFSPDYWVKNYDDAMAKIKDEAKRVEMMADAYRTFEINKLGIYNWDKLMKEETSVLVKADFKFDVEFNDKLTKPVVIYVPGDNKSVIKYTKEIWSQLPLAPDSLGGRMFAVLPGNKLALFTAQDYEKINFDSLRKVIKPEMTFNLKTQPGTIETAEDLKKLLGI